MKERELQQALALYRAHTGNDAVDMHDVAQFALNVLHFKVPEPPTQAQRLAKDMSRAARTVVRRDGLTGRPYRANQAYSVPDGNGGQVTLWVDIDKATPKQMKLSIGNRREQMVGDAYNLSLDVEHWNAANPKHDPLQVELDFGFDVDLRMAGEDDKAA